MLEHGLTTRIELVSVIRQRRNSDTDSNDNISMNYH